MVTNLTLQKITLPTSTTRLLATSEGKAAQLTADILAQILLINNDAFNTLKKDIAGRKLFVLFEEKLNCDTMTDHLNPKNVLPLYSEYIATAQRAIS